MSTPIDQQSPDSVNGVQEHASITTGIMKGMRSKDTVNALYIHCKNDQGVVGRYFELLAVKSKKF